MSQMDELIASHVMLMNLHMTADPVLELANTAAWLCPVITDIAEYGADMVVDMAVDDPLLFGVMMLMQEFPEIYERIRPTLIKGATFDELSKLICGEINAEYPYLNMEWIWDISMGPPLAFQGAGICDGGEGWEMYEDSLTPLFLELGILMDGNVNDDRLHFMSRILAGSLEGSRHRTFETVLKKGARPRELAAFFLRWVSSTFGVTLLDYTADSWSEMGAEYLLWSKDQAQFASECNEEAQKIMPLVWEGHRLLTENEEWHAALLKNWARMERSYDNGDKFNATTKHTYRWPARTAAVADRAA